MLASDRSAVREPAVRSSRGRKRVLEAGGPVVTDPKVAGVALSELASVNGTAAGPRSKRAAIIDTAVERFGETGYEATKWSEVADEVGIRQTALYHYFESKAHCLLTIMRLELARSHQRFLLATAAQKSPVDALRAGLEAAFDVEPAEVSQLRILMANGDILANPRATEREERERTVCLALLHRIESSWTELLGRQLKRGSSDTRDPKMLAMAMLGLINSVWRWFRSSGKLTIHDISVFYVDAAMRMVQ